MTTSTTTSTKTHSLAQEIANALTQNDFYMTKTHLREAPYYGTHRNLNDNVVIANFAGIEIDYRVHKCCKVKRGIRTGDLLSGYSIIRQDGKLVGVHDLRGLPKSRAAAAKEIAWDAKREAIRILDERSKIAKNIRTAIDRKSD